MASACALPGKMLAVVLNDTWKDVTTKLTVPAGYTGKVYDLESGKAIDPDALRVGNKNMRLIVFEEKK